MIVAVVNSSGLVINTIIADITDLAPEGCTLIATPDVAGNYPAVGWSFDGTHFIDPNLSDYEDYSYGN